MATAIASIPNIASPRGLNVAQAHSITKTYGAVTALRNVDLDLRSGELLALLGPNGAGKTTLVRMLLGLAASDSGRVTVFGSDPRDEAMRYHVGAMLQVARVPETLKVREHIDLFSSYYPGPLPVAETLRIAGLEDLKDRRFGELSGGQRQRVLFGISICGDPDLLFLDEPTVGLDVEARRLMWTQIRALVARGKTVLLTTHYLNEADALADRIMVLSDGAVVAEGTPAEIKSRAIGKQVRFSSRLSLDQIRSIPGVTAVTADRDKYELHVQAPEPVVRELLQRDAWLTDLEITTAGLEEAFLALTKNQHSNGSN